MHAVQTNEIFLMVADLFAHLCILAEQNQDAASSAFMVYSSYVRNRWDECVVAPAKQNPVKLKKTLQRMVGESWQLLSKALHLFERGLETILTQEYLSRSIGMFEQNNVGIRLDNPLIEVFSSLATDNPGVEQLLALVQAVADAVEGNTQLGCVSAYVCFDRR